jgi:hypothetical protein
MKRNTTWTAGAAIATVVVIIALPNCTPFGNWGMGRQDNGPHLMGELGLTANARKSYPPLLKEFDELAGRPGGPGEDGLLRMNQVWHTALEQCPPENCLSDELVAQLHARLETAATLGDLDAQQHEGNCYRTGLCGFPHDFERARAWYRELSRNPAHRAALVEFESGFTWTSAEPEVREEGKRIVARLRGGLPAALKSGDTALFEDDMQVAWSVSGYEETCFGDLTPYLRVAAGQGRIPWPARLAACDWQRALKHLYAHEHSACVAEVKDALRWARVALAQKKEYEARVQHNTLPYTDLKDLLDLESGLPDLTKECEGDA